MTSPYGAPLVDPEHDVTATYAVDPTLVRRLATHLVGTSDDQMHTSRAPFTGQPIAVLQQSTSDDVAVAAERARQAGLQWRTVPLGLRAQILLRFHDLVLERQEEILDLIQWESGKARMHAFEEVAHVAMTARYYARTLPGAVASRRGMGLLPGLTRVDVHRTPKGVVGIISPWNYPFTLAMVDGIAAIAAGNAIVHKPDSQSMISALYGVDLLTEAGLPESCWQVVTGPGSEVGPAVVDNADYVCFTGSTDTGRSVGGRAATRLVGASLELGGKNPMLVLHDADLERAAEGAVRGCFSSAGQLCVSMERLYVDDSVYDRFMQRFLRRIEDMRLSAELDYSADMGSLVSQEQLDRVIAHVEDARDHGASVLVGGFPRPDAGPLFYAPTVLAGVTPEMACFAEETFGPVVSVYRFADEADAVARANGGNFGLNACVYTEDGARGRRIARQVRCGTVNINEAYAASFGSVDAPMGGMRDSGLGRRQGIEGIRRFTDTQTVATQRGLPLRPVLGMSGRGYAKTMTGVLRVLKRLGRA